MHIIGRWNLAGDSGGLEYSFSYGNLGLKFSEHVTVVEDEATYLVYQGTIFDKNRSELMLNQDALDKAYGLYSYIKIDKHSCEVVIGTDKLGFSPIYYARQSGAFIFSTSLTLLKYELEKVSPDYEALEEILNLWTLLGDKTPIKEISRLGLGTRIHISREEITFKQFWSPEIPKLDDEKNFIPKLNELLLEAMSLTRTATETKIVLMSGGEDSRCLGIAAYKAGLNVTFATQTMTNGLGFEQNLAIAREVSQILKVPFRSQRFPAPEEDYNDAVTRDFWLGGETFLHNWALPLIRSLPENSLIYDGIAGDVTVNGHWVRLFPDRYSETNIDKVASSICNENAYLAMDPKLLDSTLLERVREQLLRLPECPARVDYFYLFNRARRNISGLGQLHQLMGHKTCYPYLYYPLFMQSLALEPLQKTGAYLQRASMTALDPAAARIPTTRDKLDSKYQVDLVAEHFAREDVFLNHIRFSKKLKQTFPTERMRFKIFEIARMFGFRSVVDRLAWRARPLGWMNDVFEWLEDNNRPTFPVEVDEPPYIKKNQID